MTAEGICPKSLRDTVLATSLGHKLVRAEGLPVFITATSWAHSASSRKSVEGCFNFSWRLISKEPHDLLVGSRQPSPHLPLPQHRLVCAEAGLILYRSLALWVRRMVPGPTIRERGWVRFQDVVVCKWETEARLPKLPLRRHTPDVSGWFSNDKVARVSNNAPPMSFHDKRLRLGLEPAENFFNKNPIKHPARHRQPQHESVTNTD